MSDFYIDAVCPDDEIIAANPDGLYIWSPQAAGEAWKTAYRKAGELFAAGSKTLVLPTGIPGSGKSTVRQSAITTLIRDYETKANRTVSGGVVFFDAMWLFPKDRSAIIHLCRGFGVTAVLGVYCATPYDVCVARQATRPVERRIPESVIYAKARSVKPPTVAEGYDAVVKLRPGEEATWYV